MTKKLTKHNGELALVLDQDVLNSLGIDQGTELQLIVMDDALIVKPKKNKRASIKENGSSKDTNRLMDKYESVLKKLAKT